MTSTTITLAGQIRPARMRPRSSSVRRPALRLDVTSPVLAAEIGAGVRVMKLDRGTFDTMPLSLITTRTVDGIGALLGTDLNVLRFRPNLVVEALGAERSRRTSGSAGPSWLVRRGSGSTGVTNGALSSTSTRPPAAAIQRC